LPRQKAVLIVDAMLGAIAFDTTTERRTQRFKLDASMAAKNLAVFVKFFTGFYSDQSASKRKQR